eukprot:185059-Prymnesium_polylepis.1
MAEEHRQIQSTMVIGLSHAVWRLCSVTMVTIISNVSNVTSNMKCLRQIVPSVSGVVNVSPLAAGNTLSGVSVDGEECVKEVCESSQ